MSRTIIRLAKLIDGSGNEPIADATVVIEGDMITSVSAGPPASLESEDVLLDFSELVATPGLIDGHVHFGFGGFDTTEEILDVYAGMDDPELAMFMARNAAKTVLSGVTTVRECGGRGRLAQQLRDSVYGGYSIGPRILASGMPVTTTAGHCHYLGGRADSTDDVRRIVRQLVQDDADVIKMMLTGGRMTRDSNTLACQYSQEQVSALSEEAHRLSRRAAAHVLSTEGIRRAVRAGIDTLEHCRWQDEDANFDFDAETIAGIRDQGIHVSLTMAGNIRVLLDNVQKGISEIGAIESERFRTERAMFDRGMKVFLTSDAGVASCRFEEFWLSMLCAEYFLELNPLDVIRLSTSAAAEALGVDDQVGLVQPGYQADLVLLTSDPSQSTRAFESVAHVMLGGEIVNGFHADRRVKLRRLRPMPRSHAS